MFVQVQTKIEAPKEQIWEILSDIENAAKVFKDIKRTEIVEKPEQGILGLKWREVREFMGREATETMWITDAEANVSYTAEARNSGCLYHTAVHLQECEGGVLVSKSFRSTPETFFAKLMTPMMALMKGTLEKCILKDLEDIKSYLKR